MKQFSAQEGSNPLFDFKDAMVKVYKELGAQPAEAEGEENRRVIARAAGARCSSSGSAATPTSRVAEEAERGTAKGRSFEELVHATIEEIAAGAGRRRPPHRRLGERGRQQEGRQRRRDRRRARLAAGDDRVRGEEQAAVQERRLDRAQRLHGRARRLVRRPRRRRRRQGPGRARGADRVPGQQDDRRPRPRRARTRWRCGSSTATSAPGSLADGAAELDVDAAGVRDAAEEAGARLKRAQPGPQVADQRHQQRQGAPATSSTRWSPTSSAAWRGSRASSRRRPPTSPS